MQGQQNYQHTTHRQDWENVLDELFITIAHFTKVGVAVISNTNRLHDNDGKGTVMPQLNFRMDSQQSMYTQQRLKRLSYTRFDQLFVLKRKLEPEAYDCYHVRQSEILKNKLLYFVEQDKKKAILVFALPVLHRQLNKQIQKINTILRGRERKALAPVQHVPGAFPRYRYPDIKLQLLKNRLNYLDGKDNLNFSETEEMRNLKDFIIQKMTEEF